MTLSGAFRGLLLDAAESNRLQLSATHSRDDRDGSNNVLSVGSLIGNPIDGGFASLGSAETFMSVHRSPAGRSEHRMQS